MSLGRPVVSGAEAAIIVVSVVSIAWWLLFAASVLKRPEVQSAAPVAARYVPGPVWIDVPFLGPVRDRDFDRLAGGLDV